ncbi:MAG: N-formylglutamate amidohydrolase [Myxococcota bacterium]
MTFVASIPDVLDALVVRGADAPADASGAPPVDLLIEVPHGATATSDYTSLARLMTSPLPDGLVDFFHVNTDTGAPELAEALARRFVSAEPRRSVGIIRCRIPRTFIDCNRVVDASAEDFKAGGVAPGLMPWVVSAEDQALLRARYDAYTAAVRAASAALAPDGAMLLLHTYAPRTVGVQVDFDIVKSLHHAYGPEVVETWPLRPELDVIARGPDGRSHAPEAIVDALRAEYAAIGYALGDSATYPLHPSTMGWEHVMAHPGRAICIEWRRDLFVERFEPFVEAQIDPAHVERLAGPLVRALRRWWSPA